MYILFGCFAVVENVYAVDYKYSTRTALYTLLGEDLEEISSIVSALLLPQTRNVNPAIVMIYRM